MGPGIGQNASCAVGDCLTSRPKGRLWPRELWFLIYSCTCTCYCMYRSMHVHVCSEVYSINNTQETALAILPGKLSTCITDDSCKTGSACTGRVVNGREVYM